MIIKGNKSIPKRFPVDKHLRAKRRGTVFKLSDEEKEHLETEFQVVDNFARTLCSNTKLLIESFFMQFQHSDNDEEEVLLHTAKNENVTARLASGSTMADVKAWVNGVQILHEPYNVLLDKHTHNSIEKECKDQKSSFARRSLLHTLSMLLEVNFYQTKLFFSPLDK